MDVLRFGGTVLLAGSRTQNALQTNVERLASGLRINTSADDPSGLAIAETLVAKVAGLDQGVRQIQDASNALTVADGALAAISGIVQRMRTLVVSARSDLLSTSDKADVQTEHDQLTREINQIAQNTNFNQSFRAVWDVGNWDAGGIVIPAGESGEPGSPHYQDLTATYNGKSLAALPFSRSAVQRHAGSLHRPTSMPAGKRWTSNHTGASPRSTAPSAVSSCSRTARQMVSTG